MTFSASGTVRRPGAFCTLCSPFSSAARASVALVIQAFATLGEDRTVRLYPAKEMTAKDVKYAAAVF